MPLQDLEKPYRSLKYRHEWYKLTSSVGMKQKTGAKKQIWSFGGKSGLGRDQLMQLGVECLRKLDAGESEAVVKDWVVGQCKDLAVEP